MPDRLEKRELKSKTLHTTRVNKGGLTAAAFVIAGVLSQYTQSGVSSPHANDVSSPSALPVNSVSNTTTPNIDQPLTAESYEPVPAAQGLSDLGSQVSPQQDSEDPGAIAIEEGSMVFDRMVADNSYLHYLGKWDDFWNHVRSQCRSRGVSDAYIVHCVSSVQDALQAQKDAHFSRSSEAAQRGDVVTARREAFLGIQVEALSSPAEAFSEAIRRGDPDLALDVYHHAPDVDHMGHERISILVPRVSFSALESAAEPMHATLMQIWSRLNVREKAEVLARIRYETSRLFEYNGRDPQILASVNQALDSWNRLIHYWFPGEPLQLPSTVEEDPEF
jgi:hypothetical protein